MRSFIGMVALFSLAACTGDPPPPLNAGLTPPRYLALAPDAIWTARACVDTSALATHDRLDALVDELFAQAGLRRPLATASDPSCRWSLRVSGEPPSVSADAQSVWDAGGDEPDRFAITSVARAPGSVVTTIFAATERAASYGVRSALQLFVAGDGDGAERVLAGTLVDHPGFARRGIIEGFYGPTVSPDERARLIGLAGYLRQNSYLYALKDEDPFTHTRWRDPYDAKWGPVIAQAASLAQRNFIDFVWAASPGWYGGPIFQSHSIHYGSDEDFGRLVAKTENLRALGVSRFALFVDDVPSEFAWPDDAARFSSLAEAHASLMNRWDDYLMATGAPQHLWVVGSKYTSDEDDGLSGVGWQDYNRTLAAALHPEIQMFWTGPRVYSQRIASADLIAIEEVVQRRVLVWDNWPKLPEALTGRAPDLDRHAGGLLSNFVMDNDHMTPHRALPDFERTLGTIADYAWQPEAYDADASLARWTPLVDALVRRLPTR